MSKPAFRSEFDAVILRKEKEKVEAERDVATLRKRLSRAEHNVKRRERWIAWLDRRIKLSHDRVLLLPTVDMLRESNRIEVRRNHVAKHRLRLTQKNVVVNTLRAQLDLAQQRLNRLEAEFDAYKRQREVRYKQFLAKLQKREDDQRDEDQIIRFNQRRDE